MKKNISINISGIIFHIEEDGYEQLRAYLDTINTYFSAYEDSGEIIADIESRMAEIFLAKLKEGKQIITAQDVQSLMATMGSIQDFEAIEEEPKFQKEQSYQYTSEPYNTYGPDEAYTQKRLFRDNNRKILGGVAAGIANYFHLDPLWIRLILIILFFDVFISFSIGSIVVIGYIICWIVIPVSNSLEDDRKVKKMYRNPDDKVLGGVSGGLAAYFGVDATIIRLLFVISIFIGGAGVIIYFILWIITPEAKSLTEKMQMQGEPVTLSNIESNIKKSLNVQEGEDENIILKILLFPFRLIAIIFSGLGRALGPLLLFVVEAIRILFGVLLVLSATTFLFFLFISAGVLFGFVGEEFLFNTQITDFPLHLIPKSFPLWGFIALFIALAIPSLAFALAGIAILAKRKVVNTTVAWTLFAFWVMSSIGLVFTIPAAINSFKVDGSKREVFNYDLGNKTAIITANNIGLEDYHAATLRLVGHSDPKFKLIQKFYSKGSSSRDALENTEMLLYNVDFQDSIFIFDANLRFTENALFRGQGLEMVLYIPYNKPFVMQDNLKYIMKNTLYPHGYSSEDLEGNTWIFTEDGLKCTTCPEQKDNKEYDEEFSDTEKENTQTESFSDFDHLNIEGLFEIVITQDSEYSVTLSGEAALLEDIRSIQSGRTLNIQQQDLSIKNSLTKPKVKVLITMPGVNNLDFSGITNSYIEGFDLDKLNVKLSGSSRSEFRINVKDLSLDLSGDSKLELIGEGDYLRGELSGASRLLGEEYSLDNASLETSGVSQATVNVSGELNMQKKGASTIDNVHDKSTAQSHSNSISYFSKVHVFYYGTLLKSGLLEETSSLDRLISAN